MPTIDRVMAITSIPPMKIVRRGSAKRWHLLDEETDDYDTTFCGQKIRASRTMTAYDAKQITCTDCLVAAISRGGANR